MPAGGTEARKRILGDSPLACLGSFHQQLQDGRFSRASQSFLLCVLSAWFYNVALSCSLNAVSAIICAGCCKNLIWWCFTFHLLLLTLYKFLFVLWFFIFLLATYSMNSFIQRWKHGHHRSFSIRNTSLKQKAGSNRYSQIKYCLEGTGTENTLDKTRISQWDSINTTDRPIKKCMPPSWFMVLVLDLGSLGITNKVN